MNWFPAGARSRARVVTRRGEDRVHAQPRHLCRYLPLAAGDEPHDRGAGCEKGPDWSPNGSQIVYQRAAQIWSMNADGSGQTALTGGINETGQLPAWSPDGTKIVFDSNGFTAPNGYDIFVMNADGTNETRIDTAPTADLDPSWQPIARPGGTPAPRGAHAARLARARLRAMRGFQPPPRAAARVRLPATPRRSVGPAYGGNTDAEARHRTPAVRRVHGVAGAPGGTTTPT